MKARDVMSHNAECVSTSDTLETAAKRLADAGVGSMPICGEDDRLKGMLTDRDIVVKAVAEGKDLGADAGRRAGRGQAGHDRRRRLRRARRCARWPMRRCGGCR